MKKKKEKERIDFQISNFTASELTQGNGGFIEGFVNG